MSVLHSSISEKVQILGFMIYDRLITHFSLKSLTDKTETDTWLEVFGTRTLCYTWNKLLYKFKSTQTQQTGGKTRHEGLRLSHLHWVKTIISPIPDLWRWYIGRKVFIGVLPPSQIKLCIQENTTGQFKLFESALDLRLKHYWCYYNFQ